MEHIVQFGVTVDDDAIKKRIEVLASETVVKEIRKELGIDDRYHYSESVIRKMVNQEVQRQFDLRKDEIIKETAKQLTEKLARTKAVKEATAKVLDEVLG